MKRVIKNSEDILAMAKLSEKYADKSITGEFGKFIYFSKVQHGSGPRIKFYGGGDKSNNSTIKFPTLEFNSSGASKVIGDENDFPKLKDKNYMDNVKGFVNKFYPLLLLVWYNYMDEADLNHYFEGTLDWNNLMSSVELPEDCVGLEDCKSVEEVDSFCRAHDLYNFASRRKQVSNG